MRGVAIVLVLLFAAGMAVAQATKQAPKQAKIGVLVTSTPQYGRSRVEALRVGLRELGYVESRNLVIEVRYASGKLDDLDGMAADLLRQRVDVFVTEGTPAAIAAVKAAAGKIPVVMGNSGNPVGAHLVSSLDRPGGNLTGLSGFSLELVSKRLELLRECVPSLSRVAVLFNPGNPTNPLEARALQEAAGRLRIAFVPHEVTSTADIERAFASLRREPPGGVIGAGDGMIAANAALIAKLAIESKLPVVYSGAGQVEAGGLMSYGSDTEDLFRRAAAYVDKILKGARPGDLPVEQPTRFELVVNLAAAKAIGLTIPASLLARADEIRQ